ncbi:MAG: long-chain fatty acid--CoA ligase [Candidatus Dormibacteria bacterium]
MATGAPEKTSAPPDTAGIPTLVDQFRRQVSAKPNDPAMYFRSAGRYNPINWEQFGSAQQRVGAYLLGEGVDPGDHVAIWSDNRPEWHIADIATMSVRARPAPIYLTLSADQAGYILEHCSARVCFVENEKLLARVLQVRKSLPKLRRIVVFEGQAEASPDGLVVPWAHVLEVGETALREGAEGKLARLAAEVKPDDVATLIYTSGTTGPPKASQITHANAHAAAEGILQVLAAREDDIALSYLPLAHVVERLASEFRQYRFGGPVYFLDGMPNLGPRLREVRPTIFFGVPRVWEKMAQQVEKGIAAQGLPKRLLARWALRVGDRHAQRGIDGQPIDERLRRQHDLAERLVLRRMRAQIGLDRCRICASGAAPIALDVLRFFDSMGLRIYEGYGQTENCAAVTMNAPSQYRQGTVGRAIPGVELKVAEDGEVLMRGGGVFAGYFKDKKATQEIIQDGWLHTGDVGEIDQDGFLKITDRKKDLIITAGGKNISPGNIEGRLQEHKLVANAVAIGDQRPYISALLTLDPEEAAAFARSRGIPPEPDKLARNEVLTGELQKHVDAVNGRLSKVEQVKRFVVLPNNFEVGEELTPTLKVKRKAVVEKYSEQLEELYSKPRD